MNVVIANGDVLTIENYRQASTVWVAIVAPKILSNNTPEVRFVGIAINFNAPKRRVFPV